MFLGMHIGIHDTNISLYKNGKCYYAKYERHSGIKHGVGSLQWIKDTLKKWGVDNPETQIKHFVSCDSFYEDPSYTQDDTVFVGGSPTTKYAMHNIFSDDLLEPLLINNYKIIMQMKSQWQAEYHRVDHHILHTYSTLRPYRQAVIDGKGTGNRYALLNDKILTIGRPGWPFGSYLVRIGLRMGLDTGHEINDSLDIPGKIMGLQAYGNIVEKYSDIKNIDLINAPFTIDNPNFDNKDWLDFVTTAHNTLVEEHLNLFRENYKPGQQVSYTGGVALNVVANDTIKKEFDLKIPPHCGDEGLSIGALAYLGDLYDFEVKFDNFPFCQDDEPSWGRADSKSIKQTAEDLAKGKIVLWYNGHGELGPRALGNRSILMDPTIKNGKQKINQVKKREPWRPFGASVKEDQAHRFFEMTHSPFMLYNTKVKYSGLPAITHRDGTCRHNTVTPEMNPVYYELLDEFEKLTGVPVLLNTSANLQGGPICGTREQAIKLFNEAKGIDRMVIGTKTWTR
tara:strand:+ start:493 stop:2019 length:1527 start_codon:yes stop_codon:yes gene_type:complete